MSRRVCPWWLLLRRARRAGLEDRIEVRRAAGPSAAAFFAQVFRALEAGGRMLVAEPRHHVSEAALAETVALAEKAGFEREAAPVIRGSRSVLLVRPPARR